MPKKKKTEIEEMEVIVNDEKVVEIEAEVELEEVKPKPEKALYYEKLFGGKK